MSRYVRVSCTVCVGDDGKPKQWDQSCRDCLDAFITAHRRDFPTHKLCFGTYDPGFVYAPVATRNLLGRKAAGW